MTYANKNEITLAYARILLHFRSGKSAALAPRFGLISVFYRYIFDIGP
jgi:hypothetical protein